jgi:hypothetical protein
MNMQATLAAAIAAAEETLDSSPRNLSTAPANDVVAPTIPWSTPDTDELPAPASAAPQIKSLSSKAVTVQLHTSAVALSKLDRVETASYAAGNVHTHIFKGSDNLVRVAVNKYRAVGAYLNDHTVPWDKGVRMVNILKYQDIMAGVRQLIADADAAKSEAVRNYGAIIGEEMVRLQALANATGKPHIADVDKLPTAEDVEAMGVRMEMSPIADPTQFGDVRLGPTDEETAAYVKRLDERAAEGGKHCISECISTMEKSSESLSVPVEDVKRYHSSVIGNLAAVASRMDGANISDDPAIQQNIDALATLADKYDGDDTLSHNQNTRNQAKSDIDTLMGKMNGLV